MSGARPGYVAPPDTERPVTPLMLEHLRAAAAGQTAAQTAAQLWVTVRAVKFMRAAVVRRLGARNMTHAVAIAYEKGLLP